MRLGLALLDGWLARMAGLHRASIRALTLPDGHIISGGLGWDNPSKLQ